MRQARRTVLALCLVGGLAGSGQAALVDSDLGAALNGGGCYSPGLTVTGPTDPTLVNPVNPEWAPVVDGMEVDSDPVLIHGTVVYAHGEIGDDFSATHVRSDVIAQLQTCYSDAVVVILAIRSQSYGYEATHEFAGGWRFAAESPESVASNH